MQLCFGTRFGCQPHHVVVQSTCAAPCAGQSDVHFVLVSLMAFSFRYVQYSTEARHPLAEIGAQCERWNLCRPDTVCGIAWGWQLHSDVGL